MSHNTACLAIAIITIGNTYRLPYLRRYIDSFDSGGSVHLISWDREDVPDQTEGVVKHEFRYFLKNGTVAKAIGYLAYRRYVKKVLMGLSVDYVVVTPTQTALLLADYLRRKYKKKYIIDIRDYAHENYVIVRKIEKSVIENAAMVVISSAGYKKFLPSGYDYYICHNNRQMDALHVKAIRERGLRLGPICIGCVGYIAYHEQHKRMIDLFSGDSRFRLSFIGAGSEPLKAYCLDKGIQNVTIRGKFDPEDILSFYEDIDVVNGIYGENCPELDYALSNKLYFAATLGIPILANKGTYTAEIAQKYGIGLDFDMDSPSSLDRLYEYCLSVDKSRLLANGDRFMEQVFKDDTRFELHIRKLLNDAV